MKKFFTLVATSLMMTAAAADEIALPPDSPRDEVLQKLSRLRPAK